MDKTDAKTLLSLPIVKQFCVCCYHKLRYVIVLMAFIVLLSTASGYFFGVVGFHISVVKTDDPVIINGFVMNRNYNNNAVQLRRDMLAARELSKDSVDIFNKNLISSSATPSTDRTSGPPSETAVRPTPHSPVPPVGRPLVLPPRVIMDQSLVQPTEPCRYLSGRENSDGRWYNFSTPTYRFFAYSVFLDDRLSLGHAPVLRVIAVTTKYEDVRDDVRRNLYCALHYDGGMMYTAFQKEPKAIGYGWPISDYWYKEYIYTCPLADGKVPRAVSIVAQPGLLVASCMPVDVPVRPTKKDEFAICVQVTYNDPNPYLIIEWLELQRLLGVTRVSFYAMDVKERAMNVLKHYAQEGFVDLRYSNSIGQSHQQYLLHGSPVINDCMYRNMYRYQHVLVIDFDEVIMPRKVSSLSAMLADLDSTFAAKFNKPPPVNYVFSNQYFFLELPPDVSESPYLTFLRYTKHGAPSNYGYSVKSIIDPQSCIQMHNHYCWGVAEGYKERNHVEVVDSNIAVNQHYKPCHLNATECANAMRTVLDASALIGRFKPTLKQQVREKVEAILHHNI